MISDAALKEAAFAVDQAMQDALPKPEECDHVFSPAFEKKMRKLIRKANHPVAYKVLNRAACALLVLVLSASLLLTFHPKARAAVVDWIKEKMGDFYHYFAPEKASEPEAEAATPEDYCLGWLPEGYTLLFSNTTDRKTEAYVNDAGQILQFQCVYSSSGSLAVGGGEYTEKQVMIGNLQAEIYLAKDNSRGNGIIWSANNGNILLCISAQLGEADLIKMAESVFIQEKS